MSNPLVSIICTCYNHQNYVEETLDSVKNQTYTNIELVIVDDFSSDNSIEVINNWLRKNPESKFIKNSKNLGLTKSFNHAFKETSGFYLMDLAADDILAPDCIEKLVKTYLSPNDDEVGLVFGNAKLIDESGKLISVFYDEEMIKRINKALSINFYQYLLSDSAYMCSVTGLYKRDVFVKLRGYDEELYFEDLDYWLRVARNYKIVFTEKILIKKRHLTNSLGNGFFVRSEHTKKLHTSFYLILKKAYNLNVTKQEYQALTKRIYKQSRWAIKTFNFRYLMLYVILLFKTYFKIMIS
ncbi:glycosyltransferase family 2 protein [Wenyingzhuangia sp. IMCC45533]